MTAGRQAVTTTKDWCTPACYLESVRIVFGGSISLDPCSNQHSIVNAEVEYQLPTHDGLREPWDFPTIFVNPPYGSDSSRGTRISHWFKRIADAAAKGAGVIALVPVATNTGHWKRYVYPKAQAICFLYEPRVKFIIAGQPDTKGAPMSCCVIYYGHNPQLFAQEFSRHGAVVHLDTIELPPGEISPILEPLTTTTCSIAA